jgi:hypothetical protein
MKYFIFLFFISLQVSSFSQTKRYYVTPQSAQLITKKITEYNKVSKELSLVKKELVETKRELKYKDSINFAHIERLDSMYVEKMEMDKKKYRAELMDVEPLYIENKKVKKQNRFLKFLIIGLTATFSVIYVTK